MLNVRVNHNHNGSSAFASSCIQHDSKTHVIGGVFVVGGGVFCCFCIVVVSHLSGQNAVVVSKLDSPACKQNTYTICVLG